MNCSIAGFTQLYSSVSSLCYVKQNGSESYICDIILEQTTSGCTEAFSQFNFSLQSQNINQSKKVVTCLTLMLQFLILILTIMTSSGVNTMFMQEFLLLLFINLYATNM